MEKPDYRAWFESTRESNQATIDQTETIFEGLVLLSSTYKCNFLGADNKQ